MVADRAPCQRRTRPHPREEIPVLVAGVEPGLWRWVEVGDGGRGDVRHADATHHQRAVAEVVPARGARSGASPMTPRHVACSCRRWIGRSSLPGASTARRTHPDASSSTLVAQPQEPLRGRVAGLAGRGRPGRVRPGAVGVRGSGAGTAGPATVRSPRPPGPTMDAVRGIRRVVGLVRPAPFR